MSDTLLSVKNLSVDFMADGNVTHAVKNISFDLAPGELVAIVGESGSGKSVTSLSLMSLLPKQATVNGQITLCKEKAIDLLDLSEIKLNAIRGKDIAMIFQEPMTSLNPVFTCGYQVMEAIRLHQKVSASLAKEKAITLFEKVRLPNPANMIDRYPHQLSGGQKQRVMIAMAMSCNPALLIADEPTTALDVTVQQTILTLIKELQSELGLGVIFITHDLGLVADISDKVLIMYKGEIVEQGATAAVLQHPQHPYTKALLACRPGNHPRGHRLPVVDDFLKFSNINDLTKIANPEKKLPHKETTITENVSNDNALVVENLQVFYPGKKKLFGKNEDPFKAVDDVSFCVQKGESVGLVGESGCGKTTLGRAILQLVKPTAGNIILDGINIAH